MMDTWIALLIALAVWTALQMYYCGRGHVQKWNGQGVKTAWERYLAYWKTWKGRGIFLGGIAGILLCSGLAAYYKMPYINCIRNGLTAAWLLTVALIDAKEQIIPHALTISGFLAWVVLVLLAVFLGGGALSSVLLFSLGGCGLGGGVFFLCRLLARGGVGMGDIRVFGILGLLFGMNDTFSIVFFTILFMSVYGIGAVLCRKKNMKSQVPMGPFILAAYMLCCILGV